MISKPTIAIRTRTGNFLVRIAANGAAITPPTNRPTMIVQLASRSEDKVKIKTKFVENPVEVHHKQVITYLKLSEKKLALLVNFNCAEIEKCIFRKVNSS